MDVVRDVCEAFILGRPRVTVDALTDGNRGKSGGGRGVMTRVYRVGVGGGLPDGVILSGHVGATRFSNADPCGPARHDRAVAGGRRASRRECGSEG